MTPSMKLSIESELVS